MIPPDTRENATECIRTECFMHFMTCMSAILQKQIPPEYYKLYYSATKSGAMVNRMNGWIGECAMYSSTYMYIK